MFKHVHRLLLAMGEVQTLAPRPLSRMQGTPQQRANMRAHARLTNLGRRMQKACDQFAAAHA